MCIRLDTKLQNNFNFRIVYQLFLFIVSILEDFIHLRIYNVVGRLIEIVGEI